MRGLCLYKVVVVTVLASVVFYGCSGCLEEERRALLQLRDSLNYPSGSAFINEWVGDNCCAWLNVFCDPTNLVSSITIPGARGGGQEKWYLNATIFAHFNKLQFLDLSNNNIGAMIMPEALCGLHNLVDLDLSDNHLNGESLPGCPAHAPSLLERLKLKNALNSVSTALCGFRNLEWLDLSHNNLLDESLPSCLSNLSSLQNLELSANWLKDSFGFLTGICELRNLQDLRLGNNLIEGNINPCLGEMKFLEYLDLSQNQLKGNVPSFIFSNLTSLTSLHLESNQLNGTLPFSMFANLTNLEFLDLSDNADLEVETESPSWIPSFELSYLFLINCNLNKRNGHSIPSFISTHYSLVQVYLSYNDIQGTIPSSLLYNNTQSLYLSLRGNMLVGQLPVSSQNKTSNLRILDISDNQIHEPLPANIGRFFPNLIYFNMSTNALEGGIPPSFGDLLNLKVLDLSNNALVGEIPHGLTQNTSLLQLVLSNNKLHGELLPRLSNMTGLLYLHLHSNNFTGPIPISLLNVPILTILDISRNFLNGSIPNWLPLLPNLISLLFGENQFEGHIPTSLCQMQNLRTLDLSGNDLSGSIPSCLNNVTSWKKESKISFWENELSKSWVKLDFNTKGNEYSYQGLPLAMMTGIDLSMNRLWGEIPSQMGDLVALHSLNLSHNLLTGHFPESFQKLENLESLDLSRNKLVGEIPLQMVQLDSLSVFNVSFNNLSGKIPYEKKFLTFDANSYTGNFELCGPPLEVNCPSNQPPQREDEVQEDDESRIVDNDLFFYSCVAICYVLGFWVVIAPLLLSRKWRIKYYGIMDGYIYWCSERLSRLFF